MKPETKESFSVVRATHLDLFGDFFVDLFKRLLGNEKKPQYKIHGLHSTEVVLRCSIHVKGGHTVYSHN